MRYLQKQLEHRRIMKLMAENSTIFYIQATNLNQKTALLSALTKVFPASIGFHTKTKFFAASSEMLSHLPIIVFGIPTHGLLSADLNNISKVCVKHNTKLIGFQLKNEFYPITDAVKKNINKTSPQMLADCMKVSNNVIVRSIRTLDTRNSYTLGNLCLRPNNMLVSNYWLAIIKFLNLLTSKRA